MNGKEENYDDLKEVFKTSNFSKLSLKQGDILVVRPGENAPSGYHFTYALRKLNSFFSFKIPILVLTEDTNIEKLSEQDLRKLGLVKANGRNF